VIVDHATPLEEIISLGTTFADESAMKRFFPYAAVCQVPTGPICTDHVDALLDFAMAPDGLSAIHSP
jgi:hypothetical protein